MSTNINPDKKVVVRGTELVLDMAFTAVQTVLPAGASIVVQGKTYNQADLQNEIAARRAPLKDVRNAVAETKRLRATLKDERPGIEQWVRALRTGLRAYLGETNPDLEKFGFKVIGPRRNLTAAEKALRADKAKRTREARHTMGPRQKEGIRAPDVPSIVIPNPSDAPASQPANGASNASGGTH